MKDLEYYLSLPWTIQWSEEEEEDGRFLVLEIAELPGLAIVGRTQAEVLLRYRPALELFLESYLMDGEEPPLPATAQQVSGA
ncbi:hypothetical protein BH24GEM3_BH24GEM3_23850 [soil metagenome]|jgi:predicted RNase H-like HicB family nuclease|nr:hypothetical protein [Gemmatimonadota bacterium]